MKYQRPIEVLDSLNDARSLLELLLAVDLGEIDHRAEQGLKLVIDRAIKKVDLAINKLG